MNEQGVIIIQVPSEALIALAPDDASAFIDQVRGGASPEELSAWVETTLAASRPPYDEAADLARVLAAQPRFEIPDDEAEWLSRN